MVNALEQKRPQSNQYPCINVGFTLSGKQLPADHGYLVYAAISKATGTAGVPPALSALHKADWLAVELISGFPSGPGLITLWSAQNSKLGTRNSKLNLRIPADHYRNVLPLAGKRLDIGGHQIRLGLPVARPLDPAPSLYARVVTIKKFTEADPFLEAVSRQLDSLEVTGRAELPRDEQGRYRRRIVTIHGKSVVGFSVAVHDLNEEDSLKLQSSGIGGRRAMGCGIFNPIGSERGEQDRQ